MNENATLHIVGINDEQTICDKCGKIELRRTVILADEDGEVGRYGTTCAARVLGRTGRGQGARVWDEAVSAHRQAVAEARQAREMLAFYVDVEADDAALVARYRAAHGGAAWMAQKGEDEVLAMARDMFARRRAQLAAAVLIGV